MKRAALVAFAVLLLVLALGGGAFAQTPQDIYEDYVLDGSLDGTYTEAELRAFLDSALIHQYGDPSMMTALDSAVRSMLGGVSGGVSGGTSGGDGRSNFPFTGVHLVLMALGAAALAGGGVGIRRLVTGSRG